MKYTNVIEGVFISRPNRFIAHVLIDGKDEVVHVKNTGRCRELLIPGVKVRLEVSSNPERKTRCDLIMVYKEGLGWINMDSQAPNKVVYEWLMKQNYDYIKPEYKYGNSRVDFYMEKDGEQYLLEIKGCTLEIDGIGYFPDAPTERGAKHIYELIEAKKNGIHSMIGFVIQMEGVTEVYSNKTTDPKFALALDKAREEGVEIINFCCQVGEDSLEII